MRSGKTRKFLMTFLVVVMLVCCAYALLACDKSGEQGGDCKHENATVVSDTATCTEDGVKTFKCEDCGEEWTENSSALGHSYGEAKVITAPTCTQPGTQEVECSVCGEKETETVAALGHDYETQVVAPTCTEKGYTVYTCKVCQATYRDDETEALGHSMIDTVEVQADCTKGGSIRHSCENCNYSYVEQTEALGHDYSVIVETKNATCTEGGYTIKKCSRCASEITTDITKAIAHELADGANACEGGECKYCHTPIAGTGHDYVFVSDTATCTEDGVKLYRCSKCEDELSENSPATGHSYGEWSEEISAGDAECHYVKTRGCDACGAIDTEDVYRHVYSVTITKTATCEENSGVKTYTCKYCEDFYTENYTDPNNHKWVAGTPEDGYEVYTCGCGAVKKVKVTSEAQMTITSDDVQNTDELGTANATFSFDDNAKAVLADKGNMTISAGTLSKEDLEISQEVADKIGDRPVYDLTLTDETDSLVSDFGEGKVTVRVPYVLAEGEDPESIAIWYINDQGEVEAIQAVYSDGYAIFETNHFSYYTVIRLTPAERCALYGHSYSVTVVNPTCYAGGYTVRKCLRCGEYEKYDETAKLEHDYEEHVTQPTCTSVGWTMKTCKYCNKIEKEIIPAFGHIYVVTDEVLPTCTHTGSITYTCSRCSDSYTQTIAMTEHDYETTVVAPTCTTYGYTAHKCKDCGFEYQDKFTSAWGHDMVTSIVAPTCTEAGYTVHKCGRCDYAYESDFVPAAGHTWDIEAPTCGRGQVCTVCGAAGKPATGQHNMVDGQCTVCGVGCTHDYTERVVDPTCTSAGYTEKVCSICGSTEKYAYLPALGHNYVVIEEKPATCTASGYIYYECSRCQDEKYEFFNATGHTYSNGSCTSCGAIDPSLPQTYLNLFKSFFLGKYTVDIDVSQFAFTTYSPSGLTDVTHYNVSPTVAQLAIDVENRAIDLYCELIIDIPEEDTDMVLTFMSYDHYVYMIEKYTQTFNGANSTNDSAIINTTDNFLELMGLPFTEAEVFDMIDTFTELILPAIENVAAENYELFNMWAGKFYESAFTKTETESGTLWTLNAAAATEFFEDIVGMPVKFTLDKYFGDGSFDAIREYLEGMLDKTVVDAYEDIEEVTSAYGLTTAQVNAMVNFVVNTMFDIEGDDAFDFERDILGNEEYRTFTVKEAICSIIGAEITDFAELYDSLLVMLTEEATFAGTAVDVVCGYIADVLGTGFAATVSTTGQGYVQYVSLEADGISFDDTISFTGSVKIYPEEISSIDMHGKAELIQSIINIAPTQVIGEYESVQYNIENGKLAYSQVLEFANISNAGNYYYVSGTVFGYVEPQFVEYIVKDCTDIYRLNVCVPLKGEDIKVWCEDDIPNDNYSEITDYEALNLSLYLTLYYNVVTGAVYYDSCHDWSLDNAFSVSSTNCAEPSVYVYTCSRCDEHMWNRVYDVDHEYECTFELIGEDCEDGVRIIYTCKNCGEVNSFEVNEHYRVKENVDLSEYGIADGVFTKTYCPCGFIDEYNLDSDGFKTVFRTSIDENTLMEFYEYEGAIGKTYVLSYEELFVDEENCLEGIKTSYFFGVDPAKISENMGEWYNGTDWYDKMYVGIYQYVHHQSVEVINMFDPELGCEGGYEQYFVCKVCGEELSDHMIFYDHNPSYKETDMTEYGCVCGGTFIVFACECGKVVHDAYFSGSCIFSTHEEILSDYETVYTCTCDYCGFSYRNYRTISENGCVLTITNTYEVFNGSWTELISYDEVRINHDFELVSYNMLGETCNDGVEIVKVCKHCGLQEEETIYSHETFERKIDLREYGCVCDTYIVEDSCICGEEWTMSSEGECDFDLVDVSESYDSEGRLIKTISLYRCAVTDPQCAFEIYGVENRSYNLCTVTVESYCQTADGIIIGKKHIRSYDEHTQHQTENTVESFDDQGNKVVVTTTNDSCACGARYTITVSTYVYSPEGEILSRKKTVSTDHVSFIISGEVYYEYIGFDIGDQHSDWLLVYSSVDLMNISLIEEYEYDTENCLRRYKKTQNGSSSEWGEWEEYHIIALEWTIEENGSCTQPSVRTRSCMFCNEGKEYDYVVVGHSYIYDTEKGYYVCSKCGLVNFNGADGDIVLEDLGTDEDYVVGYFVNSDYTFVHNVTLIGKTDGEEILLEGILITDEQNPNNVACGTLTVSKAEVLAAVQEKGLSLEDYDVRISFVPMGVGGNLDYGITFTDGGPEFDY